MVKVLAVSIKWRDSEGVKSTDFIDEEKCNAFKTELLKQPGVKLIGVSRNVEYPVGYPIWE